MEVPGPPTSIQENLRIIQPCMGLLRYAGLGILFLLIYTLVLRPVTKQVLATLRALPERSQQAALPAAGKRDLANKATTVAEIEGELQRELSETSSEVMRAVVLKRHLVEKVKKEPENATRLIQGWVRQSTPGA